MFYFTYARKNTPSLPHQKTCSPACSHATASKEYIFMKLGVSHDKDANPMDARATLDAYRGDCTKNGLTWFSTKALHHGMSRQKVLQYSERIASGEAVRIFFARGEELNDIFCSAAVLEVASSKGLTTCPDEAGPVPREFGKDEQGTVWLKLTDFREETTQKASMFKVISSGRNLKDSISSGRCIFAYICPAEGQ